MAQVEEGDDDEDGAWETEDYATDAHKVTVIIENMGSGRTVIRQGS